MHLHGTRSYCLDKASGRAVVRINGRDHYLGPHGSLESHEKCARLIAEWRAGHAANSRTALSDVPAGFSLSISEVILRYRNFAEGYYCKNGEPTKEFVEMKYALRPLGELYGNRAARDFGPLKLKAVRQHMFDVQELSQTPTT